MRIAIFGAGGVGGYLGARLAEAGHDVVLIARGEHLRALREHGLRLESVAGDAVIHPIEATDDPAVPGPVEAVLVTVKAWDLEEAARAVRPLVGPESAVVPLLNGVEAADVVARALGRARVVGGLCGMISFIAGPGHIKHAGAEPWVTIGEFDGDITDRVRRLEAALRDCRGLRVGVAEDIHAALWEKFLFVVSSGGVAAVTRSPFGVIRSVPEARVMLEDAMREILAVARARGIAVAEDAVAKAMTLVDSLPPDGTASMQRDIMAGRRSELDAWNGAVVRLGREAAVPTPVHSFIYAALLPQELGARGELDAGG
jgi:2-dehydropantoate 2-reductase